MQKSDKSGHFVAIFGGAVAGSEAAERLASRGINTVVFEQNKLPYGKIESGLPKWHVKLRDSQESKINQKLKHPLVQYAPGIQLGIDIQLEDMINNWGFSAILLATGAWRDRPLPINGIDKYINKGLYYQNPFVAWFNHNHIPDYSAGKYIIPDDVIVIGGGLASFDVVKIIMLETTQRALTAMGFKVNILTLEKKGVVIYLEENDLTFDKLGIKGCTLYYRRSVTDMPLTALPKNPTSKDLETAARVRKKIFDNIQKKYQFQMAECHMPVDKIVENDRLTGLIFQKTENINGRVQPVKDRFFEKRSPLVISAIGSLPEPIHGLNMKSNVYEVTDHESGKLAGFNNVFALGNAVTGRGNIKESQVHGRQVSEKVMDEFLVWQSDDYDDMFKREMTDADKKIDVISDHLSGQKPLKEDQIAAIYERIHSLQNKTGYDGNYDAWIEQNLPVRLESMIEN